MNKQTRCILWHQHCQLVWISRHVSSRVCWPKRSGERAWHVKCFLLLNNFIAQIFGRCTHSSWDRSESYRLTWVKQRRLKLVPAATWTWKSENLDSKCCMPLLLEEPCFITRISPYDTLCEFLFLTKRMPPLKETSIWRDTPSLWRPSLTTRRKSPSALTRTERPRWSFKLEPRTRRTLGSPPARLEPLSMPANLLARTELRRRRSRLWEWECRRVLPLPLLTPLLEKLYELVEWKELNGVELNFISLRLVCLLAYL